MNEDKRIPINLKILDTCLPDYFQGFSGPVIAFPVDASMTYSELVSKLTDDDAWPERADIEDVRSAVVDLIGNVNSDGSRPYSNIGPDEPPSTHFVSLHPTVHDMWMVIDKDDGEVMSSWPTEIEANIAAWGETGEERPADVYAYFGIELEVPDGYTTWRRKDNDNAWYWEDELGVDEGDFDTEMEAKVAAWNHHLSNSEPAEWSAGSTWGEHYSERSKTEILSPDGVTVEIIAQDQETAEALRDRIINLLNA